MKTILKSNNLVLSILNRQSIHEKNYRLLTHLLIYDIDEGKLIYNCLTGELILLSETEFLSIHSNSNIQKYLIENWFMVPVSNNDNALCDNLNQVAQMFCDSNKHPPIVNYTIFTTTDCNARCFYCFESKRQKMHMSINTAYDVANFIERSCKGNEVTIRWFGGEPLYNAEVIDVICMKLKEKNISYTSTMVSNGYLFNEAIVSKTKKLWNLKSVKIAVDGTEEIYNKYKAYIYNNGSAFVRVLNNIQMLLENEIDIIVRLNMDEHNVEDLYLLVDQLFEKFGFYKNFSFDLHMLLENSTEKIKRRTNEERHIITKKYINLKKYINSKIPPSRFDLSRVRRWKQCMADDNASTTILPNGNLGKCDYYTDSNFWGNIYDDEILEEEISKFKKIIRPDGGKRCEKCSLRPICYKLELCSDKVNRCDEFDQSINMESMRACILNEYQRYKSESGEN